MPSGIPDFRSPGTGLWEDVDPMKVGSHRCLPQRHAALLELLPAALRRARREAAQRRPRRARRAGGAGDPRCRGNPEHRPPAHQGRVGPGDRGPRVDRHLQLHHLPQQLSARERGRAVRHGRRRHVRVLHGQGQAGRRALRRAAARGRDGRAPSACAPAPTCCCASGPRSRSTRSPPCPSSPWPPAARSQSSPRARPPTTARPR